MTSSTITRRWMEHSGGSKFYQIILISRGSRHVTAFHYAGFRGDHKRFRRPLDGGQVEIKSGDLLLSKTVEKEKRKSSGHYSITTDDVVADQPNDAALEVVLVRLFGSQHAHQILTMLDVYVPSIKPSDDSDTEGIAISEPPVPIERPANWGAW